MFGEQNVPISRKMFDKHDTDKSGCISSSELRVLCRELGHHLSDEEFALVCRCRHNVEPTAMPSEWPLPSPQALVKLDTNDDHKISYDEFKTWWAAGDRRWCQLEHTEEEMAKLAQATAYFNYFDQDQSGRELSPRPS